MKGFPYVQHEEAAARVLLAQLGVRRAVASAEATAAAMAAEYPQVALLYAGAARILERGFVEAKMIESATQGCT